MEAHCVNLELKYQNQALKEGKNSPFLKVKSNEAKVKHDIDVLETMNIELKHKVAKLHKENKTLKKHYKDLYDSIKVTRANTLEYTTSLMAKNDEFKAQLQEKEFVIAALRNKLSKLAGNSMNTKFAKSTILGKSVLQPHRNQSGVRQLTAFKSEQPRISKPQFASQVDVNNDLPKPVTTYYLPKERESASAKPHHVIASSNSRNSSKNMPRFSSNDMVHNHYLAKALNKTQDVVGLRWVPTRKIFTSSTTKVDNEPANCSNEDITNQYECKQTLDVSADILNLNASTNDGVGRLLESFQEDAKYEHDGQDIRSHGGRDNQDKQEKDLKISESKTKSKDNDKGSRLKVTQHEGTSLQRNKDQRFKSSTTKQSLEVQGSKI
nr:hypothetical protein [Tanacetum cinerariifolium]GFA01401.1 hypothetical protein [Tanacetum cinerariifolium]